jgi:transcriptional regulator with XRE-family HTH domain
MPREISQKFAKLVRDRRQELGLSIPKLSELVGIGKSMVTAVERGERAPSLTTAAKYATALQIDMALAEFLPEKIPKKVSD